MCVRAWVFSALNSFKPKIIFILSAACKYRAVDSIIWSYPSVNRVVYTYILSIIPTSPTPPYSTPRIQFSMSHRINALDFRPGCRRLLCVCVHRRTSAMKSGDGVEIICVDIMSDLRHIIDCSRTERRPITALHVDRHHIT